MNSGKFVLFFLEYKSMKSHPDQYHNMKMIFFFISATRNFVLYFNENLRAEHRDQVKSNAQESKMKRNIVYSRHGNGIS